MTSIAPTKPRPKNKSKSSKVRLHSSCLHILWLIFIMQPGESSKVRLHSSCLHILWSIFIMQTGASYQLRGGKYTLEEVEQLKTFFVDNIARNERPTVPQCRPYLSAYPNPKERTPRDIRDKMRQLIPLPQNNWGQLFFFQVVLIIIFRYCNQFIVTPIIVTPLLFQSIQFNVTPLLFQSIHCYSIQSIVIHNFNSLLLLSIVNKHHDIVEVCGHNPVPM